MMPSFLPVSTQNFVVEGIAPSSENSIELLPLSLVLLPLVHRASSGESIASSKGYIELLPVGLLLLLPVGTNNFIR
jgi:hypothetical protein